MPTYEYECESCGHSFEEFQYMSDKPLRKCPQCGKAKLTRLIGSGAGIIFKGSGFYETDYKRKGQAKPSETGSPETKKPDSAPSDSSPDRKPAASDSKPAPAAKAS